MGRHRLPRAEGARRGRSPGRLHGGGHRDLRDPRDAGGRDRPHPGVPARIPVRGRRADLVGALRSRGFLRPPDAGGGPDDGAVRRTALHERALRPGVQPRRLPLGRRRPELDRAGEVPRRRRGAGAERGSAAGVARRGHHGSLPGLPVHAGTDGGLDRNAHLDGGLDGWRGDVLRAEAGPGEDDRRGGARSEGRDAALPGRVLDSARGGPERALPGSRLRGLAGLLGGTAAHRDLLDRRPGFHLERPPAGGAARVSGGPAVPARGRRQRGRRAGGELVRHPARAVPGSRSTSTSRRPSTAGRRSRRRTGSPGRSPSRWGPAIWCPRPSPSAGRKGNCGSR